MTRNYPNYPRRPGGHRRSGIRRGGSPAKALTVLLVVVLVAAVVYFSANGTLGKGLLNKIIPSQTPQNQSDPTLAGGQTPDPTTTETPTPTSDPASGRTTTSIRVDAMNFYGVQVGVYSDEANAKVQQATFEKQGIMAYPWQDGDQFRLLSGVYTDEAMANAAQTALKNAGTNCLVTPLTVTGLNLKVQADQAQTEAMQTAIAVWREHITLLMGCNQDDASGAADIKSQAAAAQEAVTNARNGLIAAVGTSQDVVLSGLQAGLETFAEHTQKLATGNYTTDMAFFAEFKYNLFDIVYQYQAYIKTLTQVGLDSAATPSPEATTQPT